MMYHSNDIREFSVWICLHFRATTAATLSMTTHNNARPISVEIARTTRDWQTTSLSDVTKWHFSFSTLQQLRNQNVKPQNKRFQIKLFQRTSPSLCSIATQIFSTKIDSLAFNWSECHFGNYSRVTCLRWIRHYFAFTWHVFNVFRIIKCSKHPSYIYNS